MINRRFFFDHCRSTLFAGRLGRGQVAGLGFLLDVWEQDHATWDDRWLAYALATAYHETAFTMQPIRERGGNDYFARMYDPNSPVPARARLAARMGARPGDGVLFHGRGYAQLTWRVNYARMGAALGIDLTSDATAADRALEPTLAARILFTGMAEGAFTGKTFAHYFAGETADWNNARRIINGLDCAEVIAIHGKQFYAAIGYTV